MKPNQSLILISGPPGVGKSTLARPLAKKLGAVLLDKDCVDEPFSPNDRLIVLECVIAPKKLRQRIQHRGLARDHVKLTDEGWKHFMKTDRIGERNPLPHVVIDMSQSPEICLTQATERLETKKQF